MMSADAVCGPARPGTILGIARSIANPTYRRLERAEPWLRFALPALVVLFLICLVFSAAMQVWESRKDALQDAADEIDVIATLAAAKVQQPNLFDRSAASRELETLARSLPESAVSRGRTLLLVDEGGTVLAAYPRSGKTPERLIDLQGEIEVVATYADRAGVMTITLGDGVQAIATVRKLPLGGGEIAVVQSVPLSTLR